MTNSTATTAFTMGPLPRTDFTSEQDRANTYAAALQNQQIVVPAPSQAGNVKLSFNQQNFTLTSGITFFDTALNLTQAIVQLITTNTAASVGISGFSTASGSNAPGVVNFSAAIPDSSYTLVVTQINAGIIESGTLVPPNSDPHISGAIWNNNGVLAISGG